MDDNIYQPPKSDLVDQADMANQQKLIRLKWITFFLLILIGLPGLFVTGCGIMFVGYAGIGLIFAIPGAIVCYCVCRGLRTVFSERGKDYAQLKETYVISLSFFVIVLFLLFVFGGSGIF
jgi:hypothetical protein